MKKFVIGVDIGGTTIKIGAVSDGKVYFKKVINTPSLTDCNKNIDSIASVVNQIAKETGANAVGVGVPGIIDSLKGEIIYSNNIAVSNVAFANLLSKKVNLNCKIINDANAATLAEWKYGAGKGFQNVVMFTLGTGVGCGTVIGDKPLLNGNGFLAAGGHVIIKSNGRKCNCGSYGCLEQYASATALIKDTKKLLNKRKSILSKNNLSAKMIFDAEEIKDSVAVEAVEKYICYLSDGIASVYNLLFPQVFILGGGVGNAGERFIKRVEEKVKQKIYCKQLADNVIIKSAKMGNDAGIIGAALFSQL